MKINNLFDLLLVIIGVVIILVAIISLWEAYMISAIIILGLVLYVMIASYIRKKFFDK